MSRQTDRAEARWAKKVADSKERIAARIAKRKENGLTPLSKSQAKGYPDSKHRPFRSPRSWFYPFSSARQDARYARQAEGRANG